MQEVYCKAAAPVVDHDVAYYSRSDTRNTLTTLTSFTLPIR